MHTSTDRHRTTIPRPGLVPFVVVVVVVLGSLWAPFAGAAPSGNTPVVGAAEEQQFVDAINQIRTSKGLPALTVLPDLQANARWWALAMMGVGSISHSSDLSRGVSEYWHKLGENVGVGPSVDDLTAAFVASPTHYANLVDPEYRYIGIGVVWDGDRMFTTQRFMSTFPGPRPATAVKGVSTRRAVTHRHRRVVRHTRVRTAKR